MGDLVRVYAVGDPVLGELMRARLEAEGIDALLKGGEEPYRLGPAYLFVDGDDEARARAVIDAVESGAFALSDEGPASDEEPASDDEPASDEGELSPAE